MGRRESARPGTAATTPATGADAAWTERSSAFSRRRKDDQRSIGLARDGSVLREYNARWANEYEGGAGTLRDLLAGSGPRVLPV